MPTDTFSPIHRLAILRAMERGQITEWHRDLDGNLHVKPLGNATLVFSPDHIEPFIIGMMVGEG